MLWIKLITLLFLANALLIQIACIRHWNAVSMQRHLEFDDPVQSKKSVLRALFIDVAKRLRDRAISKFSPNL